MEIQKDKKIDKTYYDKSKIADEYYDIVGENVESKKKTIDSGISEYLKETGLYNLKNKKVLDLGCGNGRWAEHFLDFEPESVVGVDISEEMIKKANDRKKQHDSGNLEFVRGDQNDIPLADNSTDVIFSRFSLCYAKDIEQTITDIKRVLKSGGELYVVTSFASIQDDSLAAELRDRTIPLLLGTGKEKVKLENYPHSLERYKKAFEAENLSIINEQVFSAEDLTIPEDYPNRDKVKFCYVVFKIVKSS